MPLIDLKVNKSMLDIKFEGYKLSLEPIPVLKQPVLNGVKCIELGREDYSYAHTRMNIFLNHLFQDPWSPNCVFYVNEQNCIMWTSFGQDSRLNPSKVVWEASMEADDEQANVTMCFPGPDWTVLCSGKMLHILHTPSRAAGEPWTSFYSQNFGQENFWYLQHSVYRSIPSGQQIDCLLCGVVNKSSISEMENSSSSSFISVLLWLSFSCGQNIQNWSERRTRKLLSSSCPEYAAIDCSCDAVCIVSQNDFKFFYDSDGLSELTNDSGNDQTSEKQKYTYIQTPEDITIVFRVPEGTKKAEIQVNFSPMQIEVLYLGKSVIAGSPLANCIDVDGST